MLGSFSNSLVCQLSKNQSLRHTSLRCFSKSLECLFPLKGVRSKRFKLADPTNGMQRLKRTRAYFGMKPFYKPHPSFRARDSHLAIILPEFQKEINEHYQNLPKSIQQQIIMLRNRELENVRIESMRKEKVLISQGVKKENVDLEQEDLSELKLDSAEAVDLSRMDEFSGIDFAAIEGLKKKKAEKRAAKQQKKLAAQLKGKKGKK